MTRFQTPRDCGRGAKSRDFSPSATAVARRSDEIDYLTFNRRLVRHGSQVAVRVLQLLLEVLY